MDVKTYYEDCVTLGVFDNFKQSYHIKEGTLSIREQDELDHLLQLRKNVLDVFYSTFNIENRYMSKKQLFDTVYTLKQQHLDLINESIISILVE